MNEQKSLFDKINDTLANSVTLKLVIITFLTLLLLIPESMVQSIIRERTALQQEANVEVSAKWAKSQEINGPVLSIPMEFERKEGDKMHNYTHLWHLLPDDLEISGQVEPTTLKRGIYKVVVYQTKLKVKGKFALEVNENKENLTRILWNQAYLTLGISDLRGIQDQISFKWGGEDLGIEPGSKLPDQIKSGITIPLANLADYRSKETAFSFDLDLQGSKDLSFVPTGKRTKIDISSPWESPSFNGNFLPDSREVSADGFKASWTVLQLNRNFPQSWFNEKMFPQLSASAFGVELMLPMDDYQKSMRTVKYGIMIIALTFLIFFLVEIRNKRKIHPIQYTFVGLALSLFYILLVSISEHLGFNWAYALSAITVTTMVFMYSLAVFKNLKLSALLLAALSAIFIFLFVNLQLAEYALLLGSIGLTLILALTMYLTRKINWYGMREG
jgi:inner membrane protein